MALSLMTDCAAIGIFKNQEDAEAVVRLLVNTDVSVEDISVVGGPKQARAASLGDYAPPEFVRDGLKHQNERQGLWLGGALGLLVGFETLLMPGLGVLTVLGPMVGLMTGAGLGGGLGDVFGGVNFLGFASDYRRELAAGHFLVIVHCTPEDQERVEKLLDSTSRDWLPSV